eukprot:TRINITY_DN10095_c0_g1_i1.p2 TRINITY_DN10095_c0_g1~~TRINITY_DN10095_c0_g1_i1.p2  ORF type:complete len:154 (-),score=6.82 TRINITY_DN10095_c0_g1_i1:22-483(-)
MQTYDGHGPSTVVDCMNFTRDGARIMSGSNYMTILVHDVASGTQLVQIKGVEVMWRVVLSADETSVVLACGRQGLRAYDLEHGRLQKEVVLLSGGFRRARSVAVSRFTPWNFVCPLRELCVTRLGAPERAEVPLVGLPTYIQDEIQRRRRTWY